MKIALVLCLLAVTARAQPDPWKDQADKTKGSISALQNAIDSDSYDNENPSPLLKLGKSHAKAVLKKQKQRLAAIEKGRALQIPADRTDRGRYATYIRGNAELLADGAWRPLKEGYPLAVGDHVRVGSGGLMSLWLPGGFLTLDENSDALISDEKAVSLNGGRMHWENLTSGGDELQCRTPTVAATIKGTEFDMLLRGAESVFIPFSGVVELRSLATNLARAPAAAMKRIHATARKAEAGPETSASMPAAAPVASGFSEHAGSRIESAQGPVSVTRGGTKAAAHAGDGLKIGDIVATGAGGRATLELEGGFRTELLSNTTFQIEKQSYSLLEGLAHIWTALAHGATEQDWSFHTPNAVAAVRGTSFKIGFSKQSGRDEFVPESGVLEVTAKRDPKLDDGRLWWNQD